MIPLAGALPENSHDGYVAAAYIVFFALVLIYIAIMAVRIGRIERRLHTLKGTPHNGGQASELQARREGARDGTREGARAGAPDSETTERELV